MSWDRAPNRTLLHQYPPSIREAYRRAVQEYEPAARHREILRLAQTALAHFASIAFADYRARRWKRPEPRVEALLEFGRLSMGGYLGLLRASRAAIDRPVLDVDSCQELTHGRRFAVAVAAVDDAIRLGTQDLPRFVHDELGRRQPRRLSWIEVWARLVEYRNRAEGHPAEHRWPTGDRGYYQTMLPLLEPAVVEAITAPPLDDIVLGHPVAELRNVHYRSKAYVHVFTCEDHGAPRQLEVARAESLTDTWSLPAWHAEIGCTCLLRRLDADTFEVAALYADLLSAVPSPLSTLPATVSLPVPDLDEWMAVTIEVSAGTLGEAARAVVRRARAAGLAGDDEVAFVAVLIREARLLASRMTSRAGGLTVAEGLALRWEVRTTAPGPAHLAAARQWRALSSAERTSAFRSAMEAAEGAAAAWRRRLYGRRWEVDCSHPPDCPLSPDEVRRLLSAGG